MSTSIILNLFQSLQQQQDTLKLIHNQQQPLDLVKLRRPLLLDNPSDTFSKVKIETQRKKRATTDWIHRRVTRLKRRIKIMEALSNNPELENAMAQQWLNYIAGNNVKTLITGMVNGTITLTGSRLRIVDCKNKNCIEQQGIVVKSTNELLVISTIHNKIIRVGKKKLKIMLVDRPDIGVVVL
jgi:RNase P/RNase MRP subunit p29